MLLGLVLAGAVGASWLLKWPLWARIAILVAVALIVYAVWFRKKSTTAAVEARIAFDQGFARGASK